MQHAFTPPLSLSHCHFTLYGNNAHIAKCGSDQLQTKGYGDQLSNEEGGHVGIRAEAADFPPQQWLQTDPANLWSRGLDAEQMTCLVATV